MSKPRTALSYQHCIVCGRWYPIWRCKLLAGRKFCSPHCFHRSWAIFKEALANGQLAVILADEREAARAKRAAWKVDDWMARKLAS